MTDRARVGDAALEELLHHVEAVLMDERAQAIGHRINPAHASGALGVHPRLLGRATWDVLLHDTTGRLGVVPGGPQ